MQPSGCSLTQEAPGIKNKISALHVQLVVHSIQGCQSRSVADTMANSILLCVELCAVSSIKEAKPLGLLLRMPVRVQSIIYFTTLYWYTVS